MEEQIKEIVLTGGPCGGKTTALSYLSEKLMDRGYRVFIVPEVATMVIGGGVSDIGDIAQHEPAKYFEVEKQMLRAQLTLRHAFWDLARIFKDEKRVIIFDRATMDVLAYVPPEYFRAILEECRLTLFDVRDSYDGVIHLVTAARGAEEFYTTANNKARREDIAQARVLDAKTLRAWTGTPHLKIIDNSTDFEGKMKRLLQATCRMLGIPVPLEIERKFFLKRVPDIAAVLPDDTQQIFIEQMYLVSDDGSQVRIRKRSQGDSAGYFKTIKTPVAPGVRRETEETISPSEYVHLQASRDPKTRIIRKHRYCFVYSNQYFELDVFIEPTSLAGFCILEIELTEENDALDLPPFLETEIEKEVTDDPAYSNYELSQKTITEA